MLKNPNSYALVGVLLGGCILACKTDARLEAPLPPQAIEAQPAAELPADVKPAALLTKEVARKLEPIPPQAIIKPEIQPELPKPKSIVAKGPLRLEDNILSHLRKLSSPEPWGHRGKLQPYLLVDSHSSATLADARKLRAKRRAFDGAPPTMGHSEHFGGDRSCLDCHNTGMTIGDRIARPMSHVNLPNCKQCHIEEKSEWLDPSQLPKNDFVGWWNSRSGEVSMTGAPPTMPHGTFLRTACLSCHGEFGYEGLRTSHPERASCMQCHIQSKPMIGR